MDAAPRNALPSHHVLLALPVAWLCLAWHGVGLSAAELTPLETLGQKIFFDTTLSNPAGQSCASCHAPEAGFTSPDADENSLGAVHPGAVKTLFGNRKPPTIAYASQSPKFSAGGEGEPTTGGLFWDGRVADLQEQATKPLLNPLEQNNAGAADLLKKLNAAAYRALFETVNGQGSLAISPDNEAKILDRIATALAAYEASSEINPFSSKYDAFLAGKVKLSEQEARGLELFEGKANCFSCHPSRPSEDGKPPLFTDYTYDNLGFPRNPKNPFYRMPTSINPDGDKAIDLGLGGVLKDPKQYGRFKVPTLRNVDKRPTGGFVKVFGHNGYFTSLKAVIHFYNVRDAGTESFDPAEVPETVNHTELGNLSLTDAEEDDLVAFLKTLSDGYIVPKSPTTPTKPRQPVVPATYDVPKPAVPAESGPLTVLPHDFAGARQAIRVFRFVEHKRTR